MKHLAFSFGFPGIRNALKTSGFGAAPQVKNQGVHSLLQIFLGGTACLAVALSHAQIRVTLNAHFVTRNARFARVKAKFVR